jgi:hypothetical protein
MSERIYVPPKSAPRYPPADHINNSDKMLGLVILAAAIALVLFGGYCAWRALRG